MTKITKKKKTASKGTCVCPYCEEELIIARFPYCKPCGMVVRHCVNCQITVMDRKATKCPKCGGLLIRGEGRK